MKDTDFFDIIVFSTLFVFALCAMLLVGPSLFDTTIEQKNTGAEMVSITEENENIETTVSSQEANKAVKTEVTTKQNSAITEEISTRTETIAIEETLAEDMREKELNNSNNKSK